MKLFFETTEVDALYARPEDGPDEILFASGGRFYLLTIPLE